MFMNKKNNNDSRTENFVRNTSVGILMQIFSLVLSFVSRTIFIKLLTNDYLSINGLFSNILSTLSIVELGFGTALIYYLYKPVANNDKEEIKVILKSLYDYRYCNDSAWINGYTFYGIYN